MFLFAAIMPIRQGHFRRYVCSPQVDVWHDRQKTGTCACSGVLRRRRRQPEARKRMPGTAAVLVSVCPQGVSLGGAGLEFYLLSRYNTPVQNVQTSRYLVAYFLYGRNDRLSLIAESGSQAGDFRYLDGVSMVTYDTE